MNTLRLKIELVPACLWGLNVRSFIPKSRWAKLRKHIIAERGMRCETCAAEVLESAQLNAHETWSYDETQTPAVATLTGVKLTCKSCHSCEHWGRIMNLLKLGEIGPVDVNRLIRHFCEVNGVKKSVFDSHSETAFVDFHRRSVLEWRVDWGPFAGLMREYQSTLPGPIPKSR